MPRGVFSRSVKTVAPVVVNPEVASKKASVTVDAVVERIKGREANAAIVIQLEAVRIRSNLGDFEASRQARPFEPERYLL